jgi:GDSL-like Lipase/Acylhydrolase family
MKMRRLAVCALAVVAMFAVLGNSCLSTIQRYMGPANAPKLYIDGDSITYQATTELDDQFESDYRVAIDGYSGNTSKQMFRQAQAAAPTAPDVAIIELGTNDPHFGMTIDESATWLESINAVFPSTTCVIFVTPWSGTIDRPAGSLAAIDNFERATFARVADWDAAVTPDDYVNGDGVHPNSVGRLHLAQVEAAAVAACATPPTTTTTSDSTTTTSDSTTTTSDSTTTTADSTTTTSASTTTSTDSTAVP